MQLVLRVVLPVVLVLAFLVTPVALHFAQKRHDRLPFDVAAAYPADRSIRSGEVFARTLLEILDHELSSPTGWRPNDFFLWGPGLLADNNANRQLGIIQALRESTRVFRDHLTKVSATEYDENLVEADTKLRNDEYKFWFPSAESRFREGIEALRRYIAGFDRVPPVSKPLNHRNVELIRLFSTWTDLLGGAHANLYRDDAPFLAIDDAFYHAQGFAHVMVHLTRALLREYEVELGQRQALRDLLERVVVSLERAALLKPIVVLNGNPDGLLANHRRNLHAYIVDARQLMYSIREELEK
jgi:hypothetical protein